MHPENETRRSIGVSLRPRLLVADALPFGESLQRLFHSEQHGGLNRGESAARRDGNREAGHGGVVRHLEDRVPVVLSEAIPEAEKGATHLLGVPARGIPAILRILDQLLLCLWRVAEPHEIGRHGPS